MTQSQLAKKLYVTKQTVSKWETGKSYPDIDLLNTLARALNVSLDELVNSETENEHLQIGKDNNRCEPLCFSDTKHVKKSI